MEYNRKLILTKIAVIVISLISCILIIRQDTNPYLYIGLICFSAVLFLSVTSRRAFIKWIGINLCAVSLALTVYETYLLLKSDEFYITRQNLQDEYQNSKFLGYAPKKNGKMNVAKYFKDEVVFKSEYTIDSNGLRISPPYNENNNGCVLFFGDSFTFGVGVNDNETMPYQVGVKTDGKYKIYNFGFGGYGPHQMLSQLENGIVRNLVSCNGTVYGIYQAIPDHINRAAGLSFWDYHGPRYVLGKSGEPEFSGNFDDISILPRIIVKYLNKSLIYRDVIGNRRFFNRELDVKLFISIIKAAQKNFEKQYPGGNFHVIFWDDRSPVNEKKSKIFEWKQVYNSLRNERLNVHPVSNILPDYYKNKLKYNVSPYDNHPNPLAHGLIAEYIINNILEN